MEPVFRGLRRDGRTPSDEGTGTVRRSYRGFFVLIPNQRPSERFAPEHADRPRAIARNRSEASAVREKRVLGLDDAELVPFRVGEHDVTVVRSLTDVGVTGAELHEAPNRFELVVVGRRREIDVDAVLVNLRRGSRLEKNLEADVVARDETDFVMGLVDFQVQRLR